MSRDKAAIVTEGLCKWYGKVVGINDFTVSIPPGITGLLGPNGAGKSTFIKLIIGALRPSKGSLRVFDQAVWGNRELLRRVGYCPDHDGVYGELSGTEFVAYLARLGGMGRREARRKAEEALDRLGLADARDRPIGQYSKGMRQRAKLAQALVHGPDLLLFDEPLTGCDPLARVQVTDLIKELGREGKAVLVSSHVLHEIEAMTSEIVLIYRGQVLAEGNIYRIREMIDRHPHKIMVGCDKPRALAAELCTCESVRAVEIINEGTLLVETPEPDTCYPLIPERAMARKVKISSLTSPDNNLQAVFEYLTQARGPEGAAAGTRTKE